MANNELGLAQTRYAVAVAYGFVMGCEATESFSAVNFEELLSQQVTRLTGNGNPTRSASGQIDRIEQDFYGAIDTIKSMPKDAFKIPEDGNNVNG